MALPLTFKLYASEYDAFIKALKVLGHVFGSDYVHSFLAMSVFMGILVASLAVFRGARGSYEFFKHIAMSLLIVNLFLAKNVTLKVYPMLGGNLVVPEEGTTHNLSLPIGVALPLWGANALSNALVRLIDTGFGCPAHSGETLTPGENLIGSDMLCYSHYGAGGVMGLVAAFQSVSHFTGLIDKNLRIYTEKCLLPAFDLTVVTRTGLERAPDIVEYLAAHSLSNWYSPYQAIPELHGGDSSYPAIYGRGSGGTCSASEGGIMWNCSCYHVFQLIKSDLAAVENQFLRSLTEHRVVGVLYGSTADLTNFRNLVVSLYGQICDATGCPDTTAGIFRHLYLTREIDFFIASYADDPARMMRLSETYRSTTEGWRGHGRFMFYFLPKIKTLLFASVPFLFLAILPFATLGRTSPFWLLLPNLIWLALWEPNLALLNDLFASEFSDQLLKLTSLWGPAHVGITNGNDVSIYMAANEKLALYGYMSTMTLMLTGIVANAVAWAIGLRGGSMSTYALERELQGVGREVGAGQKYAQLTALSGLAAAREAEAELSGKGRVEAALERNDVGMMFPTGGPPVPAMSRWEIMQELEKGQAMERGYGGLAASTAYGRLLAPKNPIDSPVSPSLVGDAKAQRMAEEAASLRAIRDFLGMDAVGAGTKLGNMAGKLAVWDRFAQYAKYGSEAGFIAAYLSDPRNASFLDRLVEKGILGYDKADLIKRGVWDQHTVERYLSGNPELLGQIRGEMAGYGEAKKLLGLTDALRELSDLSGKPYEEIMGYIARGEAMPFISMALKGDLPREARFLAASAAGYIMQQEYETGFGNFLASEKGFSSAGEALKWYRGLPEAEKMEWARKYHQSAAFRDLAGKTRMAEVVSGLTKALGTDGALTFLSKTPLFQLANERAKAARLDLLQALGDGRLDPKEMKRLEEATRGLSAMVGPKMTEHLLSHHLKGMEIPVTKENWLALSNLFGKDQLEKIGLGDPNHLPKDAMALVSLSPKFDKDGNLLGFKGYKLDVVAGGGRNIRYLRTYDEPETERVGRLGSMTISGGTRIMTGDTTEYRGLTGRMGNAEISDGHVVLGRGGTVAEFEGAVKAPDFGSIMALARKIDPQAAERLRTDSAARERIEGALKDGGQVSLDYDNGVLKIRAGSDLLYSSAASDNELVSSVAGRESVYKDIDTSIVGGQNQDFLFKADMDGDGKPELYRFKGMGYLKDGIFNGTGDVYHVDNEGREIKLNQRGPAKVENLAVPYLQDPTGLVPEADGRPTFEMPLFSYGGKTKMTSQGVRDILATFKAATDETVPLAQRQETMARAKYILHRLENDAAFRQAFVEGYKSLFGTLVDEKHAVEIQSRLNAYANAHVGTHAEEGFDTSSLPLVGKLIKLQFGSEQGAEVGAGASLSKGAKDATIVNKVSAVAQGVLEEKSLKDEDQMKVLASLWDKKMEMAVQTVHGVMGRFDADRSLTRVLSGVIPGLDTGRTAEGWIHSLAQTRFYKFLTGDNPVGAAVKLPFWMLKAEGEMGRGMERERFNLWQQALKGDPNDTRTLEAVREVRQDIKSFESGKALIEYLQEYNPNLINDEAKQKLSSVNSTVLLLPTGEVMTKNQGVVYDFGKKEKE